MKGATQCAKRVKQLFKSMRAKLGRVTRPAASDPITQLILGVLTRDAPESKAREVLERLRVSVVDYNELRVIPVFELVSIIDDHPDARRKAEDLSRALNKIFMDEHAVSLDGFKGASRRDVENYLRSIDGLEPYTIARVRLLGFGHPAVPLDEAMWAYARKSGIVDGRCPLGEAQGFLERQVAADDALEFVALLKKAAWAEMGTAVRRGEVERILSVPPDRTSRNMLQAVVSASRGPGDVATPDVVPSVGSEETTLESEDEAAAATPSRSRRTRVRSGGARPAAGSANGKPSAKARRKSSADAGKSAESAKTAGGASRRKSGKRTRSAARARTA